MCLSSEDARGDESKSAGNAMNHVLLASLFCAALARVSFNDCFFFFRCSVYFWIFTRTIALPTAYLRDEWSNASNDASDKNCRRVSAEVLMIWHIYFKQLFKSGIGPNRTKPVDR